MSYIVDEAPNFYKRLEAFSLEILSKSIFRCNLAIIWELFVVILTVDRFVPLPTINIRGKDILLYTATINDTLGISNPSNATFEVDIMESDLRCITKILVLEDRDGIVKYSNIKGTNITFFFLEAQMWINSTRAPKTCLSLHPFIQWLTTFFIQRDTSIFIVCAILGIEVNLGMQVNDQERNFYDKGGFLRDLFFLSLIIELCKKV